MKNDKLKKFIPGMRTIKTAISILIDLLIFQALGLTNPLNACIASVVCMQPSVEESVKTGKNRLIGTSIAAVAGLIIYYIGEAISNPNVYLLLIPIGVIILIQSCILLKCTSSVSIACVVFVSILTSHRLSGDINTYPFTRLIETFIGILVATFVNKFIAKEYFNIIKLKIKSNDKKQD